MSKKKNQLLLLLLLCIALYTLLAHASSWQQLAPGLEYTILRPNNGFSLGKIHVFRINPTYYQFDLALTGNNLFSMNTLDAVLQKENAILGTNGGFFSPSYKPLGLRIKAGQVLNPLKPISWWGIFIIENNQAKIINYKQYTPSEKISFAVQSGPRLLINGHIPSLKDGFDNRTALGITRNGLVILLVTENLSLSTTQLAQIFQKSSKEGGLGCVDALNLDGGNSTQMYANLPGFLINIPGLSPVADVVLVKKK
jgi:uncharacterized protein YigE (DUF2233 family)